MVSLNDPNTDEQNFIMSDKLTETSKLLQATSGGP